MPAVSRYVAFPPQQVQGAAPVPSGDTSGHALVISADTAAAVDEAVHTGDLVPTPEGIAANMWVLRRATRNLHKDVRSDPGNQDGIAEAAGEFLRQVEAIDPYTETPDTIMALVEEIDATISGLYARRRRRLEAETERHRAEQRADRERRQAIRKAEKAAQRQRAEIQAAERAAQDRAEFLADQQRLEEQRQERDAAARAILADAAAARSAEREQSRAEELKRFQAGRGAPR